MKLTAMLKRDGRLFMSGLIPALMLSLLLTVACGFAAISAIEGSDRDKEPVKVALVDNEDSVLSRISINMVEDQSYVSALMQIVQTDERTAKKGLSNGKFAAAVILPDNYMESIMHGIDCKGKIYLSDSLTEEGDIVKAISDFGSRLLTAGQYGVFAGEKLITDHPEAGSDYNSYIEKSNTGLINFAIDAYDTVFSFEILRYSDTGLNLTYYYISCWITLLLIVCGLFFPALYTYDCRGSIYARLMTRGISRFEFASGKYLYPLIFRLILSLPVWYMFGAESYMNMALASAFITLITTSIALSLSKKGGWVVSILGISAALLFMAGGCLPRTMLPGILSFIAYYSPFGAAQSFVVAALGGELNVIIIPVCLAYVTIVLILCSHFLRTLDTHSEEVRL